MHFECLANELILDLFEYLDTIDLLNAFYNLNTRFNQLLLTKFQSYYLDFRSIPKHTFEIICQKYLPLIIERIISLHLSNNEETPNLPKIFLSRNFTMNKFISLQSLSLYYIQSFEILNQLIIHCKNLIHLKHLNIIKCYFNYPENDMKYLMNNIWSLQNLTYCILDQITSRKMKFTNISIISSSIKYLTLEKITCDFKDLSHLFEYTPYLKWISINLTYGFPNQKICTSMSSLVSLKILYRGCLDSLINLFENTPNLMKLTLETFDIYCDGYDWERILINYLFNIKIFRLKMNLNFPNSNYLNQQANDLIETFRNSFWIEEHQWFVRCDWDPLNIFSNGILYTLPYAFNDCFYFDTVSSISTCPINTDYWVYDRVCILSHENPENDLSKDDILFSARFSKICHLKISFPFHDKFWSCISSLNQLKSINVILLQTDSAYEQLQELFNRAIHLYSFKLSHTKDFPMELFRMKTLSIRRFNFLSKIKGYIRYFNSNECSILIYSPLILHCEVLLIGIKNRSNIIQICNSLPHLRSLTCSSEDDEYNAWSSTSTNDEVIEWLRQYLPCKYSINRDEKETYLIRLWIELTES